MEKDDSYTQAQTLGDRLMFGITFSEGWSVAGYDYPVEEAVPEEFPDEYLPQYEVTGFRNGDDYIGVWWLRDGERLQAYYRLNDVEEWGDVYDIDGILTEIEERL
jgi:hypothetical protein